MEDNNFDTLMERLRRSATAVENEYAENDRRLTWFLIFQAFLFQAYATALQALTSSVVGDNNDVSYVRDYIWVICAVGAVTAALTALSTSAGVYAIHKFKITREAVEKEAQDIGVEPIGFRTNTPLHWLGLLPTLTFPWMLFIVWCFLTVRAFTSCVAVWPFR